MNGIKKFLKTGCEDIYQVFICPFLRLSYLKKCCLLIVLGVLVYVPYMNPSNANYDETYSMLLFGYPFKEMIRIIGFEDGHPPLYYIVYRLFQLGGDIHNIFALRVATQVVFVLTALLGVFPLKRLLGEKIALLFIVCVFFLPSSIWLATNIRMYPLALYVTTGSFIYAELILQSNKKTDWLFFALFSLACCYTHYFCNIVIALIWLSLATRLLIKKQWKKTGVLIGIGCLICLMYMPWIIFGYFVQFQNMKTLWFPNEVDSYSAVEGGLFNFVDTGYSILEILFMFLGSFCWIVICQYLIESKNINNISKIEYPVSTKLKRPPSTAE